MPVVTGTFTGTGQSSTPGPCYRCDVSVSGFGTATVKIERRVNGNWVNLESLTADGERVVENGTALEVRLNCSAYTSGTLTYALVT